VKASLPTSPEPEEKKKRMELWKKFNVTNPKSLSLVELDGAIMKVLQCEELFQAKGVILRAYKYAREINPNGPADCLEFCEFRLLLVYLKGLMGVYQLFSETDTSNDMVLDLNEFTAAGAKFESLGISIDDPPALFEKLKGTNETVEFGEFADWAVRQGMAGPELLEVELANDKAADEELATRLKDAMKGWELAENGLVRSQYAKDLFQKFLPGLQKHAIDQLVESAASLEIGMVNVDTLIDDIILSEYR